jgi:hypothetical protein
MLSPASRHIAFVRSRGGVLDDHPFLRIVVELVTSLRRFVFRDFSLSPIHPLLFLVPWLIWMPCAGQH